MNAYTRSKHGTQIQISTNVHCTSRVIIVYICDVVKTDTLRLRLGWNFEIETLEKPKTKTWKFVNFSRKFQTNFITTSKLNFLNRLPFCFCLSFSSHYLTMRFLFTHGLQVSQSRSTLHCHHLHPKMHGGCNVGLTCGWLMGDTVMDFSNRPLCLKPERSPCACNDWCVMVLIIFAHFMAVAAQITLLGKIVCVICTATFAILVGTTWKHCCGHI